MLAWAKVWGRYLHYTAQLDDAGNLLFAWKGVQGELQRSMDETCRAHGKCDGVTETFFNHLLKILCFVLILGNYNRLHPVFPETFASYL